MRSFLIKQFEKLDEERQILIWRQLIQTPVFTEFLVQIKKTIEATYFNLPEPENFEQHVLAEHATFKQSLKSEASVIDDLLSIDAYMRKKCDSL